MPHAPVLHGSATWPADLSSGAAGTTQGPGACPATGTDGSDLWIPAWGNRRLRWCSDWPRPPPKRV